MSAFAISPTLQQVYAQLIAFIMTVTGLPASNVVQGIPDRAAMPLPGFISVQAVVRKRLRTNIDTPDLVDDNPATATIEEGVELSVQIDCYGPQSTTTTDNTGVAQDWANILSATLRDEYGCAALAPTLQPLYADDARMIPLVDGEEQYEERWALDARFQFNPVTTIPQQYADTVELVMWDVPVQAPYGA